ncbi:MAG: DUF6065 family protein [Candidatus Solibacter sp.]
MPIEATEVSIVPLAPNVPLPRAASPRTRDAVPQGYGVQEQCLPFTAASALGFLIPSPIRFGYCPTAELPEGCRAFRSPVTFAGPQADWVHYVADNPRCAFTGNAYTFAGLPLGRPVLEPGISFFDRADQQDLFKLHLPYVWRTPAEVDTLFLPLLNRASHGLEVQSGLVETDWYPTPVNMIIRKPGHAFHLREGDDVAQAILISRAQRNPSLAVAAGHSRLTRDTRSNLVEWYASKSKDHNAYKVFARSRQGRMD